jgi:hypothetical protein
LTLTVLACLKFAGSDNSLVVDAGNNRMVLGGYGFVFLQDTVLLHGMEVEEERI